MSERGSSVIDETTPSNIDQAALHRLKSDGVIYQDLRGLAPTTVPGIDNENIERLARIVRGLAFTAVDGAKLWGILEGRPLKQRCY
jgi:hypothetical protein